MASSSTNYEQIAQKQLDAYNKRDIDTFLSCFAIDVSVYLFPNTLQYTGIEKIRERYDVFFQNNPDLHCSLTNRISIGNIVIDREYVTGLKEKKTFNATAIYEIENNLIQKIYFIME